MKHYHPLSIVLADDDAVDRELFADALKQTGIGFKLLQLSNGRELLDHLRTTSRLPDAIFLDLNMPLVDGREVLCQIKNSEKLKLIPVFVMSTSCSPQDVNTSYLSGANLYIVKPTHFRHLVETLSGLLAILEHSRALADLV